MMNPGANAQDVVALVEQLDSFDPKLRWDALKRLKALASKGQIPVSPPKPEVNLHCHTFFSYNARGYSPSRFAWEAYRRGLEVAGIVDFDCLDGVREFLDAGRLLGLKTVAGLETRVFIREYRNKVTNSPKEPGVSYLIAVGFTEPPAAGTRAADTLASMARRARERNLKIMAKINEHLGEVRLDYERDVLPLTPAGKATERHMLQAYEQKAREAFPDPERLAEFWSEKLKEDREAVRHLLEDVPALKELIRSRLMKFGGVGYARPDEGSFPLLEEVVRMTLECGAVPVGGWLDGTNDGEADPVSYFGFFKRKGIPFLSIIPDRNWNLEDAEEKRVKVANLAAAVDAARYHRMPIVVGTEMNKHGQKFVDAFERPELAPYRDIFLEGAHVAWGHTLLKMTSGVGYTGRWADERFGSDVSARNEFFRQIGSLPYPDERKMRRLCDAGEEVTPEQLLHVMKA